MKIEVQYVPTEFRAVWIKQSVRKNSEQISKKIIFTWKD